MNVRSIAIALGIAGVMLSWASMALAQQETTPIVGQQLMTEAEREQYRAAMRALETEEERAALRARHKEEMRVRARERGVELPDVAAPAPPRAGDATVPRPGRVRGRDLMTEEERKRHREEMRTKTNAEESRKARKEHHEEMKERARERGVELPEEPMPRRGPGPRPEGRP